MSIQFSDTSTYRGIVQLYEKEIQKDYGFISNDSTRLAAFVADVNNAHDELMEIGFRAGGTWQLDDINQDHDPFIKTNIVSGQRKYYFVNDEDGNLILDIYKVMIDTGSGVFKEIYPVDQQTPNNNNSNTTSFFDGRDTGGIPTCYDKTGNAIIFDLVPNYNATLGLKAFVNREGEYFTVNDTTKKPGVPGLLHRWYYLRPALDRARIKNLSNYNKIDKEVTYLRDTVIPRVFRARQKDIKGRLLVNVENNK